MVEKNTDTEFKYFVRIANTDLDGNKPICYALTKIKGVSYMLANALCNMAHVDKHAKIGYISDSDVKKLDDVLANPMQFGMPRWMVNRRKNYEDGKDYHLITSDLKFTTENDIKRLKKIRAYRGVRHALGLPTRGQRTKANFRKNKGKGSLGVKKKAQAPAKSDKK